MSQDHFLKKTERLRSHLIRYASGSFLIRVTFTALNLALAIVLARLLGAQGFGIYAFCLAASQVLAVPAMLGMQQLVVREFATYRSQEAFGLMRGLLRRARQSVLLASLILVLVAGALSYILTARLDALQLTAFWMALLLVPLTAMLQVHNAALRGLRWIVQGQLGQVLQLALALLFVCALYILLPHGLQVEHAVATQITGAAVALAVLMIFLHKALPAAARQAQPQYQTSAWLHSAWPMLLFGGMQILNQEVSIIMLGVLGTAEEVGYFRVAQRGAMLVLFGLQAVTLTIGPTISSLYAHGQMQLLQEVLTKSARAILAYSLPTALFLMLGGFWIIPVIFGVEFSPAAWPLVVLCAGQLVNAGFGAVGIALTMTRNERLTAKGVTIAGIANVVLNALLIPIWGTIGAAAATSLSIMLWNILLAAWLYQRLGLTTTAIGQGRQANSV